MSAQAEPRGGSGVWDFLRNLSEKQKGSSSEQMPEEHPRMRIGRYAAAVLPAAAAVDQAAEARAAAAVPAVVATYRFRSRRFCQGKASIRRSARTERSSQSPRQMVTKLRMLC